MCAYLPGPQKRGTGANRHLPKFSGQTWANRPPTSDDVKFLPKCELKIAAALPPVNLGAWASAVGRRIG
jgi:hypothetical protein